jgi:hypothetical protein
MPIRPCPRLWCCIWHSSASWPSWARLKQTARRSRRRYAIGKGIRRNRLAVAVACVVLGVCLIGAQVVIYRVTASGRPRALWRALLLVSILALIPGRQRQAMAATSNSGMKGTTLKTTSRSCGSPARLPCRCFQRQDRERSGHSPAPHAQWPGGVGRAG